MLFRSGFSKITLPEEQRQLSRKSISIYLYTKDRPKEEIAPRHATFYVQRPLPERFVEGYTLTGEDRSELQKLLIRRDRWIELYQQQELEVNGQLAQIQARLSVAEGNLRIPLTGSVKQEGPVTGFHGDLWAEPRLQVRVVPLEPVERLELKGFRPEGSAPGWVRILINGVEAGKGDAPAGRFSVSAPLPARQTEAFAVELIFEGPTDKKGPAGDNRNLAYMLLELNASRPKASVFSILRGLR